jgi:hypothetical protein
VRVMARAVLLTIALVLLTSASARASGDIYTLAGGGTAAPRDGMPAARANLQSELGVAALPDGGFLVDVDNRIWRVDPQGILHHVAGNGRGGDAGDGGPAAAAEVEVADLEPLAAGGFLIADESNARVRMVDANGVITTVAGGGEQRGEDVPARDAEIDPRGIAALPGGGFLVADGRNVRRVGPDGRVRTIAGNGELADPAPAPHGQPATSWPIDAEDVALAADGSVLIADEANGRVDRVTPDGALTVVATARGRLEKVPRVAALADGGLAFTTLDTPPHVWRASPTGAVTALAGGGPFIATAAPGLQQRLSGQRATGADLGFVVDVDATADGGLLISHGGADALEDAGFISYVTPAAPTVLGAAILRDRDRVFTPGGMQAVTVSLTAPASVTLSVAGRSVTAALPAGLSRVAFPAPARARPETVSLVATADTRRAFDALRIFPPGWLPTETGALVAGIIASDVDHCHRFGATRVDCLTNKPDYNCHSVTVRLTRDRLRWAEYGPCAIRSHPRLTHAPRPLTRANSGCGYCSSRLFGSIDEAALVPST